MKRDELFAKVARFKAETQETMQAMYDALDDEHRDRFDKDEKMSKSFKRHGVKGKDKDKDKHK